MPYTSPNNCPQCGRGSKYAYIERHGSCAECRKREAIGEGTALTGRKRREVLARIAAWLEQHPSPWDRANDGLFMGVPVSNRSYWP